MVRLWLAIPMAVALAASAAAETDLAALVVPPDGIVDGQLLTTYPDRWWQWALAMPQSESPIVDEVGTFCHLGQSGPVWFLAGGYGSSKIRRSCTIPVGRHLFFPIINFVQLAYSATMDNCPSMQAEAARNNDGYVYLKVFLDGTALEEPERFRFASTTCFDPFARTPAEAGAPPDALAATDGYWIMLRPLPPGPHHLEFRAFYTNPDEDYGDMVQNIAYDLVVLPD